MWPYWLSAAGLAAGAGIGVGGFLNPRWASNLVRLRDMADKPGGAAEFRATYGGLFIASHTVALALVLAVLREVEYLADIPTHWTAMGAVAVCGAMWIGTGLGRVVSMLLDGTGTKYNQAAAAVELGWGLAILAPCFFG